jgi:hypothetical protein
MECPPATLARNRSDLIIPTAWLRKSDVNGNIYADPVLGEVQPVGEEFQIDIIQKRGNNGATG